MSSRLDPAALLANPVREKIYDLARSEPGISYTELHGRLRNALANPSLGFGSLTHHLYVMERAAVLTSRRSGRHRRYYEARGPLGDPTRLSALQRPGAVALLRAVHELGSPNQTEIIDAIRRQSFVPRQTVAYRLDCLQRVGLIVAERVGRCRRYRLAEAAAPYVSVSQPSGARSPSDARLRLS